ncbi:MAG: hypothetical protein M1828_001718 [Chrysothrix sp. TS-e1954]|nr:MAG: hypothetical protein M1828_001718 [Chrysothrix sp. TS-e1954]
MEAEKVGGSIAGLMHGVMIKRLGHNVRVLEQNRVLIRNDHAAGMGTGPKGREFFQTYDRCSDPVGYDSPGMTFLDGHGESNRFSKIPLHLTSWDVLYYRLLAIFDGTPSTCCPNPPGSAEGDGKAIIDPGKSVTEVQYDDGIVTVYFNDLADEGTGKVQADFVVVADGAYSSVRKQFIGDIPHPYSGYVAWRGTVPESRVSEQTRAVFNENFVVFEASDTYVVGYAVPNEDGSLTPGSRLLNYVWYYNIPSTSPFYTRTMTDIDGHTHRNTIPVGKMDPSVWTEQKALAAHTLDTCFLELVNATEKPFVATIRDSASPRASFFDGHLVLVGEALRLLRPHTGMSANQAATHCFGLRRYLVGEISIGDWEKEVLEWGQSAAALSVVVAHQRLGPRSVFLMSLLRFMFILVAQRLGRLWRLLPSLGNISRSTKR